MKSLSRFPVSGLVAWAAVLPMQVCAQTLIDYSIGKVAQYVQTGPSSFTARSDIPFQFNAAGSLQGTLTLPNAQVEQLAYVAGDQEYEVLQNFATQASMDLMFPSGTYTFSLLGESPVNVPLTGDTYPPVPLIINGTWNSSSAMLADPSKDLVLNFSPFPGYATTGVAGQVRFSLNTQGNPPIIDTPWVSLNAPQMPTGTTIPAGTMTAGNYYTAALVYTTDLVADEASVPGALLFSTYITTNTFVILAQAPAAAVPVATSQPVSQTISNGTTVVFRFTASGSPTPSLQWFVNGAAIPSATGSTLVISGATTANAGNYTCTATSAAGSVTSTGAVLTVITTSNPGRLINLSARAQVGTGGNIIFGGFAISPRGASGTMPVLIRASGPAIAAAPFNVPGTLPDPQLQLFDSSGAVLDTNDAWGGTPALAAAAASVGAFAWGVPTSHDAALDLTLASGPYTAQAAGQAGDTGDALVEVYDATPVAASSPTAPRLVNLSARVAVGTGGNALFAGFVIGGSTSMTVLIRASGPAIAAAPFNVPGTLPDPQLKLQNPSTGAVYATNSGWGGDTNISSAAASVGAFKWNSPTSHDSALLITLPPGNYTAAASGASGDSGVAIVEVYEVP